MLQKTLLRNCNESQKYFKPMQNHYLSSFGSTSSILFILVAPGATIDPQWRNPCLSCAVPSWIRVNVLGYLYFKYSRVRSKDTHLVWDYIILNTATRLHSQDQRNFVCFLIQKLVWVMHCTVEWQLLLTCATIVPVALGTGYLGKLRGLDWTLIYAGND